MTEEELEQIKKEAFRKGMSSVSKQVTIIGYIYPNGFKVEIFPTDEDKE